MTAEAIHQQAEWKWKDLVVNVQIEALENLTKISTSALVDSKCMSSTINRTFMEQHNIPTHATAAPIPIYNADRTKNQGRAITKYTEIHLKIGDHAEQIDLAVTELSNQQIFLGHDWLTRHNPLVNWKTGKSVFA